ncbi:MAG: carboxypeptidase regulatory-like domain-containing protein [Proteobacteria bacterium]|nr:carboxypeptidase regulatory-like domain-containing protein [Pseudomonadota bacterium]
MFKGFFKLFMVGMMLTALGCTISGTVTDGDGNPMEGVTVTLTGASEQVATTDANGKYSFANLNQGTFTVTPSYDEVVFTPEKRTVSISLSNLSAINFAEYIPPEPPLYDLTGSFLVKATSPVALNAGGGPVVIRAYIEQIDNEFTMTLTDYDDAVIEGTIDGAEYLATTMPANSIPMTFGTVTLNAKFKALSFTADSDYSFTGLAKITATYLGIATTDNNVTIEAYSEDIPE